MKRVILILSLVVVTSLVTGCEEGATYLSQAGPGVCLKAVQIFNATKLAGQRGNYFQARNALSAWCWLEDCIEMLHTIIGDEDDPYYNEELQEIFDNIQDACGSYFLTSLYHGIEAADYYMEELEDICEGYQQYRRPEST